MAINAQCIQRGKFGTWSGLGPQVGKSILCSYWLIMYIDMLWMAQANTGIWPSRLPILLWGLT